MISRSLSSYAALATGAMLLTGCDRGGNGAGNGNGPPGSSTMSPPSAICPAHAAGGVSRDGACESPKEADDPAQGEACSWNGLAYEGETFTCNHCPGGVGRFEGRWRVVDFDTEDPDTDLRAKQTLVIRGNRWKLRIRDTDSGAESSSEGWYFCGAKPKIYNEDHVFVVSRVEGQNPSYAEGDVFTGKMETQQGSSNKLSFIFHDSFCTHHQEQDCEAPAEIYCRIGSPVTVPEESSSPDAGEEKACRDPFTEG